MLTKMQIRRVEQVVKAAQLHPTHSRVQDKKRAIAVVKDILLHGAGLRSALYALFEPEIGAMLRPDFFTDFDLDDPEMEFLESSISSLDSGERLRLGYDLLVLAATFEKEQSMCARLVLRLTYDLLPSAASISHTPRAHGIYEIILHLLDQEVSGLIGGVDADFSPSCESLAVLGEYLFQELGIAHK